MFVLGGNNGGVDIGDNVAKSARFRETAAPSLSRTFVAGNQQTWTLSMWVKRGKIGAYQNIFGVNASSPDQKEFRFNADDTLFFYVQTSASTIVWCNTVAVYRDISAWYHLVLAIDTTQTVAADRIKLYVNGVSQAFASPTYPAQNTNLATWNTAVTHYIGTSGRSDFWFDGYMADVNFVNGVATPSSFGRTSPDTGAWVHKNPSGLTYGTNGFRLQFNNVSVASDFGTDTSGNSNTFTVTSLWATPGVIYDWMSDTPTNNFATLNWLSNQSILTYANLNCGSPGNGGYYTTYSTSSVTTEKIYFEVSFNDDAVNARYCGIGVCDPSLTLPSVGLNVVNTPGGYPRGWMQTFVGSVNPSGYTTYFVNNGTSLNSTLRQALSSQISYAMVALDPANGNLWIGYNGTWFTGNPSTGTSPYATGVTGPLTPFVASYNDNSYGNLLYTINFGQQPFQYSIPTGFSKLSSATLISPTILKGNRGFNAVTYTGNGTGNSVTGIGFRPDFVWIKNRSVTSDHILSNDVTSVPLGARAAVGGSLATIYNLTISANTINYVLYNSAKSAGYDGSGLCTVNLTINTNLVVGSTSVNSPALDLRGFPTGCNLNVTIASSSYVVGCGGSGGSSAFYTSGNGSNGGDAIWATTAVNITNNGTIAGGGGGGGSGASTYWVRGSPDNDSGAISGAGGGGGQGSLGGNGGSVAAGSSAPTGILLQSTAGAAGTFSANGVGGIGGYSYAPFYGGPGGGAAYMYGGNGGNGGTLGQAGTSGGQVSGVYRQIDPAVGLGGSAGYYADGNSNITWVATGTRLGSVNSSSINGSSLPYMSSNQTIAETLLINGILSIDDDGFSVGTANLVNQNTSSFVAWCWKASGSTSVLNTTGSISANVSANPTYGFSIVSYTGNGTVGATIGHGLGVTPAMIITKSRNAAFAGGAWPVWHKSLSNSNTLYLDQTFNSGTYLDRYDPTGFTSSVFKTGANGGAASEVNTSGNTHVAYVFAEIAGFSKFGTYTGNGSTDGPFLWCGFRPRWLVIKCAGSSGYSWIMEDSARDTYNVASTRLLANTTDIEASGTHLVDFLSNGFKLRNPGSNTNGATTYIFAAFAEIPFKYANAR